MDANSDDARKHIGIGITSVMDTKSIFFFNYGLYY